ncbi:MAG: 4-hydroxythreonine-4-phosphate dehydrogenase PdxA [Gammaproteobacteria bacterium]|nr:4-hydroxythreonine-4-phosphate dehydrogenase PdxA [Gammaproteobacteria bacterium]
MADAAGLKRHRLALSVGEPAGIGPDLAVLAAQRAHEEEIVAFADPDLLAARARTLGLPLTLEAFDTARPVRPAEPGQLTCAPVALARGAIAGRPDPANAHSLLAALDQAWASCIEGECAALVTAPLNKGVINDAGVAFSGHTEYLAALAGNVTPVMLLVAGELRVALTTTHLPLAQVPARITRERLEHALEVLAAGLERDFGIARPRILVLGLNPHAGEGGHLGREEIETIAPVLETLCGEGYRLEGPLPADTAFTPAHLARADAVLAMNHDQGLPVLKHAGFGRAVNVTLGLPIVRTSVDHGTALDLAATGRADPGSLEAALALAAEIAVRRQITATASG